MNKIDIDKIATMVSEGVKPTMPEGSESMTYNEEIVDLLHRLGKDALLTRWDKSDDSVLIYKDFWEALSDTLQVLGIKVECPLCRKEQDHESSNQ